MIGVTNADFDTQTRNLDGSGIGPESLVKMAIVNATLSMIINCTAIALFNGDGIFHIWCGSFALLVLTREVMRDLGVG